ncbi:type VI secretion system-associated protein TagF [Aureimonas leprariae]|uniref:Type VI secretion system-associated protein TagF n=1 Tax=Plantimonas leprariae TaxID=2615207 RepID=A0A7V7TWP7_9HYPH|nr:type VI secretion system-associated protein TagF [Aureimonas leprariae]KAB0680233.1 type VI secretion system-associated protein TagF [Aureimonas leprariae]
MGLVQRIAAKETGVEAGYFGKVSTEGDFVSDGLSRTLRDRLDRWLQQVIAESRRTLGEEWTERFDRMPARCFALGPAITGGAALRGVMVPSRDRVGRRFPLIALARLDRYRGTLAELCAADGWYAAAAATVGSAGRDGAALGRVRETLEGLPPQMPAVGLRLFRRADPDHARSCWWRLGDGGERLVVDDLPGATDFTAMLGAPRPPPERRVVPPRSAVPLPARQVVPAAPVVRPRPVQASPERAVLAVSASGATHPGTRWRINADAVGRLDRPRILALADGIGDGAEAAAAARLVVERLDRLAAPDTPGEALQVVKGALGHADALMRAGRAASSDEGSGTGVVALVTGANRFAVVWAGDARAYLLRDGTMRLLTRDHVEVGLRRRLSRHVGGPGQFHPDTIEEAAAHGDRLLLCTRSLVQTLGERAVAEALIAGAAAARLIEDALIGGVSENVSAVVADVRLPADASG